MTAFGWRVVSRPAAAGAAIAAVDEAIISPSQWVPGLPPIVYSHGQLQHPRELFQSGISATIRHLASHGYAAACVLSQATWNNATARSRIQTAAAWLRTNRGCVGPAWLIGSSMGGTNSLGYAIASPADVAGVIGVICAVDMDDIRDNDRGTSGRANIDAAHGLTWTAPGTPALPAGVNPADNTGVLTGLPIQLWSANDDTVALHSLTQTFAAAVGATLVDVGALGHSDAAMAAVDPAVVLAFIRENS